jgi:hypothetical protein
MHASASAVLCPLSRQRVALFAALDLMRDRSSCPIQRQATGSGSVTKERHGTVALPQ